MLTYTANGRTFVYRAPASEEQVVVGALLAADIVVTVRSDVYRRWPAIVVQSRHHLGCLASAESDGNRTFWLTLAQERQEPAMMRPWMSGWYKDGHPAERAVLDDIKRLGAVAVGSTRCRIGTTFIIGPGDKTRGAPGRRQRYWQRFLVPQRDATPETDP